MVSFTNVRYICLDLLACLCWYLSDLVEGLLAALEELMTLLVFCGVVIMELDIICIYINIFYVNYLVLLVLLLLPLGYVDKGKKFTGFGKEQ